MRDFFRPRGLHVSWRRRADGDRPRTGASDGPMYFAAGGDLVTRETLGVG